MTSAICLINRDNTGLHSLKYSEGTWETGNWHVSETRALSLIGKRIYLHDAQDKPSRFGGTILGFRTAPPDHAAAGRVIFTFKADEQGRDFHAGRDGWSQEQKIIE